MSGVEGLGETFGVLLRRYRVEAEYEPGVVGREGRGQL